MHQIADAMVVAVRKLRQRLKDREWSQADFKRQLDAVAPTDRSSVSRWISGKKIPETPKMLAIEKLLGIGLSDWFREDLSRVPLPKVPGWKRKLTA